MAVVEARTLLGAELEGHAVLIDGFAYGLGVGDGERERLLTVHVLAGAGGRAGDQRVPALAGGDEDAIDVGTGDELAVVVVLGAGGVAVAGLTRWRSARGGLVDVADRATRTSD
jgi:hypothetical protein